MYYIEIVTVSNCNTESFIANNTQYTLRCNTNRRNIIILYSLYCRERDGGGLFVLVEVAWRPAAVTKTDWTKTTRVAGGGCGGAATGGLACLAICIKLPIKPDVPSDGLLGKTGCTAIIYTQSLKNPRPPILDGCPPITSVARN